MEKPKSDLLQGTIDLLILKTLALELMHGWGIRQISKACCGLTRDRSTRRCCAWNSRDESRPNGALRRTTGSRSITG